MKLAFLGTSAIRRAGAPALVDAGHDVIAVYTRAPKPAGRGQQERRTPVHELALSLGLPVRTPKSLKSEEEAQAFKALDLDAGRGRRLRPYPAQELPRRAGAGLHQHPRLAAAALARCGAHPSRHPGGRRRDRRHHHAHGRRVSTPARCCWPSARRSRPPTRPRRCTTGWRNWAHGSSYRPSTG